LDVQGAWMCFLVSRGVPYVAWLKMKESDIFEIAVQDECALVVTILVDDTAMRCSGTIYSSTTNGCVLTSTGMAK